MSSLFYRIAELGGGNLALLAISIGFFTSFDDLQGGDDYRDQQAVWMFALSLLWTLIWAVIGVLKAPADKVVDRVSCEYDALLRKGLGFIVSAFVVMCAVIFVAKISVIEACLYVVGPCTFVFGWRCERSFLGISSKMSSVARASLFEANLIGWLASAFTPANVTAELLPELGLSSLALELPSTDISAREFMSNMVKCLDRHKLIDDKFFAVLRSLRNNRASEIDGLAKDWSSLD